MVILKEAFSYALQKENVSDCIHVLSAIINEHSTNKSITLPILGSLLTLRDKNLNALMKSLASLEKKPLESIRRLSRQYAPDLEDNILEF